MPDTVLLDVLQKPTPHWNTECISERKELLESPGNTLAQSMDPNRNTCKRSSMPSKSVPASNRHNWSRYLRGRNARPKSVNLKAMLESPSDVSLRLSPEDRLARSSLGRKTARKNSAAEFTEIPDRRQVANLRQPPETITRCDLSSTRWPWNKQRAFEAEGLPNAFIRCGRRSLARTLHACRVIIAAATLRRRVTLRTLE